MEDMKGKEDMTGIEIMIGVENMTGVEDMKNAVRKERRASLQRRLHEVKSGGNGFAAAAQRSSRVDPGCRK